MRAARGVTLLLAAVLVGPVLTSCAGSGDGTRSGPAAADPTPVSTASPTASPTAPTTGVSVTHAPVVRLTVKVDTGAYPATSTRTTGQILKSTVKRAVGDDVRSGWYVSVYGAGAVRRVTLTPDLGTAPDGAHVMLAVAALGDFGVVSTDPYPVTRVTMKMLPGVDTPQGYKATTTALKGADLDCKLWELSGEKGENEFTCYAKDLTAADLVKVKAALAVATGLPVAAVAGTTTN